MAGADESRAIEFAKCSVDPSYFTHEFGIIDDAQGDNGGTMPFHLWPAQTGVLWDLFTHRLTVILKARQLGISWLCCSYVLWLCLFQPGKVVLLFSKGQLEANELSRRVQALYDRLPQWLRDALPKQVKGNTGELGWENGSKVQSLPATESAGRSFTASIVILDEAAFLMWAEPLYTALKPTIDGGGQLIVLSTANGLGNLFHRLWTRSVAGESDFHTIFLPWWTRPGRDQAWYAKQERDYTDPNMVLQEYPATANEAFVASGNTRFAAKWIDNQAGNIRQPNCQVPDELRQIDGLWIYDLPRACTEVTIFPGQLNKGQQRPVLRGARKVLGRYVVAGDVSEGVGGDYSVGVVLDTETWEEMACIRSQHWEPGAFAEHLAALAEYYDCCILPERNNHGHSVLLRLNQICPDRVLCGHDDSPGWLTNLKTKPIVIDLLAEALRDNLIKVRSQAALSEMQIYTTLDNGKTGAPSGYHDDCVMAWAIALTVAQRPVQDWVAY